MIARALNCRDCDVKKTGENTAANKETGFFLSVCKNCQRIRTRRSYEKTKAEGIQAELGSNPDKKLDSIDYIDFTQIVTRLSESMTMRELVTLTATEKDQEIAIEYLTECFRVGQKLLEKHLELFPEQHTKEILLLS